MKRISKQPLVNVAILMETSRSFGRGVIRGVSRYAGLNGPWVFHLIPGDLHPKLPPASIWDGDGVIGRIDTPQMAEEIRRRRLKVVCLGGREFPDQRYVGTSSAPLCELALDHLADRGFKRLGYFGGAFAWGSMRGKIAAKMAKERGMKIDMFKQRADGHHTVMFALAEWLKRIDKPAGILAGDDLAGRQVIDACAIANIHVPEQIAVIGIDNDELICELAHPSLTSVALNGDRIGFEAAKLFDGLMRGRAPRAWIEVPPTGVIARQSTELLAIEDSDVASALRYIRDHACDGITVTQVVEQISVSRRTLEERFQQAIGRSPHLEIRRVQMTRAKDLLIRSDLKMDVIANMVGFTSVQYLHAAFKSDTGMTPLSYRNQTRVTGR